MPFGPSDVPWWGWLLSALAGAFVSLTSMGIARESDKGAVAFLGGIVSLVGGVGAVICFTLGVIRFVNWAWQ